MRKLANFRRAEVIDGTQLFGNDMLPATVKMVGWFINHDENNIRISWSVAGDGDKSILDLSLTYIETFDTNYDKEIISPENISALKVKNILISSHDFEDEIYGTIKRISPGINIITIYRGDTHQD